MKRPIGQTGSRIPPFSLRLTFEERAKLELNAGNMPLGSYIKSLMFSADAPKYRKRRKAPEIDDKALAELLACLGSSRIANNLNQLAKWRKLLYLLIGGITFMVAVSSNGALGWSTAWLISLFGFFAALGYWVGVTIKSLGEVPTTFGSSRWATPDDLKNKKLFNIDAIRLGMAFNGEIDQTISYEGDGHLITVAPTRTAKAQRRSSIIS